MDDCERIEEGHFCAAKAEGALGEEWVFTADAGETGVREIERMISEQGAVPLSIHDFSGRTDSIWPVAEDGVSPVLLSGDGGFQSAASALQVTAIKGVDLHPVVLNGQTLGYLFETGDTRVCRLSGVTPPLDSGASREQQAQALFEQLEHLLERHQFRFRDTIRTWIYLDRLLEWYDEFNAVRTRFFRERGVFDGGWLPASTGIGAGNASGSALVVDLLAIQPKESRMTVREVVSPLQNPAVDYKSSFSRAVELCNASHRRLIISGTASIAPDGRTLHADDPGRQIELTLDVVEAILQSRGMGWRDLFRGIAYFKSPEILPLYRHIARERGLEAFTPAISLADVCRHDLLFEIEVDAVAQIL